MWIETTAQHGSLSQGLQPRIPPVAYISHRQAYLKGLPYPKTSCRIVCRAACCGLDGVERPTSEFTSHVVNSPSFAHRQKAGTKGGYRWKSKGWTG